MRLKINEHQEGDVSILELDGRLVIGPESEALYNHVKKLVKDGRKKIILHVQNVNKVDSIGFGLMMGSIKSVRGAGGKIFLLQPSKQVQEAINLTGLAIRPDILPVFLDKAEAIKNF